jgi:hypothetical protein
MERVEALAKRLTELRDGLGLDKPEYQLLPDDPLCVALRIPKRASSDKRRELIRKRLIERVERLDEPRLREALQVAYRVHPDYRGEGTDRILGRRKLYAKSIPHDPMTVYRDENKAIEQLAERLDYEPLTFSLLGIRFKGIHVFPSGAVMPKWMWRGYKLAWFSIFLILVIWLGSVLHLFYIGKFP